MMATDASGVVWVQWYATVLRQESFAAAVAAVAPTALRYGATRYAVHRSLEDRYRITQLSWFERESDWHRFWEGPEMIEFRRHHAGHFQIPITYGWWEELAAGELGPQVLSASAPAPEPAPQTAA